MFDPDKAIKYCNEDELGRCEFAKSVGNAILNHESEDSLVIGLQGKWGYGKTSIINMALENIKEITKEGNLPIIIQFNPWLFSNQNQLIKKFFEEFIIAIEDKNIVNKLKSYVNKITPAIIGLAAILDPERAQALLKTSEYIDNSQSKEESLLSIKKDLDKLIKQKKRKILVIIDDIDRLSDFEIRQIFQLVKLIADFPQTIYLLSFDREVVVKALENVQKNSGEKYLEKVVQIPFEVPKINESDIERLLFTQIEKVIDMNADNFNNRNWLNIYYNSLKYFFKNIRHINKYINLLKFEYGLIKEEVNVDDFLAITAVHVFFPDVYYGIRDNKDLFSGLFNCIVSGSKRNQEQELAKERCEEIIHNVDGKSPKGLLILLMLIFPKLKSIYGNTNLAHSYLLKWRKNMQICSPEYFDTYFMFSIPENEISKTEFNLILSKTENSDSFKEVLIKLNENKKITIFLIKLMDYIDEIPSTNIEDMIYSLIELGDNFLEGYTGLGINNFTRINWIVDLLLKRLDNQQEKYRILKGAIINSNSLYITILIIYDRDYEHQQKDLDKDVEVAIDNKQLDELKEIICGKIKDLANKGNLIKYKNLQTLLEFWKENENEEEVTKFVNSSIETNSKLIDFLTGFLGIESQQGGGDPIPRTYLKMNFKSLFNFIDPKKLSERVQTIASSPEYKELNKKNRMAIDLFLKNTEKIELDLNK